MESQYSTVDPEMQAWSRMGAETVNMLLVKLHDHGMVEQEDGTYTPLPSGKVGEICRTCGDLIEE